MRSAGAPDSDLHFPVLNQILCGGLEDITVGRVLLQSFTCRIIRFAAKELDAIGGSAGFRSPFPRSESNSLRWSRGHNCWSGPLAKLYVPHHSLCCEGTRCDRRERRIPISISPF